MGAAQPAPYQQHNLQSLHNLGILATLQHDCAGCMPRLSSLARWRRYWFEVEGSQCGQVTGFTIL